VARVLVAGGRTAPAPPAPPPAPTPAPPRDRCGSGGFATSSWVSRLRCSARWEALSPAIHPSTGPPALSSLPIHLCPAPKQPPPLLPTSSSPPPPFAPPLPTAVCSDTTKKRLSIDLVDQCCPPAPAAPAGPAPPCTWPPPPLVERRQTLLQPLGRRRGVALLQELESPQHDKGRRRQEPPPGPVRKEEVRHRRQESAAPPPGSAYTGMTEGY